MGYRRDSSDKEWKETKRVVSERDRGMCRLCRCLTAVEFMTLRRNAGSMLGSLDPAHYLPVGEHPELCYDPNNVCMVNHFSHNHLDNFRDPLDGHSITREEVDKWWRRILATDRSQYGYLLEKGILKEN